jgi:hypothetical protein
VCSKEQSEAILRLLRDIHNKIWRKAQRSGSDHQKNVALGCAFAFEYVETVLRDKLPKSAPFGMCRTLFEIVCSVAYLAKHEGELQDFLDFGRMMEGDLGQAFGRAEDLEIRQVRSRLRKKWSTKHGGKKFDKRRQPTWHGYSNSKELARKLGFLDKGVKQFYGLSSEAIHGDSVIALAAFRRQALIVEHLGEAAPLALKLLWFLWKSVNSTLKFGLESELASATTELQRVFAKPKR